MGCGGSKEAQPAVAAATATRDPITGIALPPIQESKDFNNQSSSMSAFSKPAVSTTTTTMPQLSHKLDETGVGGAKKGAHHLKNIFAAPLGDLGDFTAPIFHKEPRERKFIRKALERNFVFA